MIGAERRVNTEPASDITGFRDSMMSSALFSDSHSFIPGFFSSDTYAPSLANPAKRTVFLNSSNKTLLEVILLCPPMKQAMTLRKCELLMAWPGHLHNLVMMTV